VEQRALLCISTWIGCPALNKNCSRTCSTIRFYRIGCAASFNTCIVKPSSWAYIFQWP
jgi:hypothetical protein